MATDPLSPERLQSLLLASWRNTYEAHRIAGSLHIRVQPGRVLPSREDLVKEIHRIEQLTKLSPPVERLCRLLQRESDGTFASDEPSTEENHRGDAVAS